MNRTDLVKQIFNKKSFLCVGLDVDINKIPKHLLKEEDPIFAFNKAIIDATAEYCVAYKPNLLSFSFRPSTSPSEISARFETVSSAVYLEAIALSTSFTAGTTRTFS